MCIRDSNGCDVRIRAAVSCPPRGGTRRVWDRFAKNPTIIFTLYVVSAFSYGDKFSISNIILSAFDDSRRFRFFVMTSPSFENSCSLATEVAGTASSWRTTAAMFGYVPLLAAHHVVAHAVCEIGLAAMYRLSSFCTLSESVTAFENDLSGRVVEN